LTLPSTLAAALAGSLERAGIPYAIGGALAYGVWAIPRATMDVDINVFVSASDFRPALETLRAAGLEIDEDEALATAAERGDAIGYCGGLRVDLFVNSIPFHESAATRTVRVPFAGASIVVLSAEDIATLKMLFFRSKDLSDVERLLVVQAADLDRAYVRHWLVETVGEEDARVLEWDALCAAADLGS